MYEQKQVLALAYAAKRENGPYVKHSMAMSDGMPVHSNRRLIQLTLDQMPDSEHFKKLSIIEQDRIDAAEAGRFFKKFSFLILGDSMADFDRSMYEVYCKDQLTQNDLGFFAYLPYYVKRELDRQSLKSVIRQECSPPEYILSNRVSGNVKIISKEFIQRWEKNEYFAIFENKLVNFFHVAALDLHQEYHLSAKVTSRIFHRFLKVPTTCLSYVKVVKK